MRPLNALGKIQLFILLLLALSLTGCGDKEQKQVKKTVISEFGQLKDLDNATVQEYLTSESLFPDASTSQASAALIEEVTSRFFKDFDYKILNIKTEGITASCSLQIVTLDAHALAKDYQREYLVQVIMSAANGQGTPDTSLEQHYILLRDLLNEHTYKTVSSPCDIQLANDGKKWRIQKNSTLENQLVGGFISSIANPYLLTPTETVAIYFDTLKEMDIAQMRTYLGLTDLFSNSDTVSQTLAEALLLQMRTCFDHRVTGAQDNGSIASVNVELTSFSYTEIISAYTKELDKYLATTDALIDGSDGRLARSNELLVDSIINNKATESHMVTLTLINDGVGWRLQPNEQIGTALFGGFDADTAISSLSSDADKSKTPS